MRGSASQTLTGNDCEDLTAARGAAQATQTQKRNQELNARFLQRFAQPQLS